MSSFNSIVMVMIVIGNSLVLSWGQLSTDYYEETCPLALVAVKTVVALAIAKEKRMGASLLNLHFHDCFIQGCDGSILLDDTPTFLGEKTGFANNNSARGYDVVDDIKSTLEFLCPGVVSCADILAIAARDSIAILGGPKWNVKLGRRDSLTANFSQANSDVLPLPNASLNLLIDRFQDQGLSIKDMVALSGAHTIGQTRCISFRERIYNGTNIDVGFAAIRRANCPGTIGVGDNNLAPLDFISPTVFDNSFYVNLLNQEGLFVSDQILYNGPPITL